MGSNISYRQKKQAEFDMYLAAKHDDLILLKSLSKRYPDASLDKVEKIAREKNYTEIKNWLEHKN